MIFSVIYPGKITGVNSRAFVAKKDLFYYQIII
ncbi:MAG: hypothetical protein K0R65_212 [Crocinitomicaceae bacterium]|jgi:hypothetical protein|nr:hypothetical protein [Crocinitomicaceae bacterium]